MFTEVVGERKMMGYGAHNGGHVQRKAHLPQWRKESLSFQK